MLSMPLETRIAELSPEPTMSGSARWTTRGPAARPGDRVAEFDPVGRCPPTAARDARPAAVGGACNTRYVQILERRADISEARLLEAVTWVAREAQNALGLNAGQSTAEIQQRYFEWATEAERQLNSVLAEAATSSLIRSEGFWWLQSASTDAPNLIRLVNSEYERVIRLLNASILDRPTDRFRTGDEYDHAATLHRRQTQSVRRTRT